MSGYKKHVWYIYTMEYYTTERKKELLHFVTTWMDGTGEQHYAKWNKSVGGEGQIPYDLTYKWNLINKTSKQNMTRDIEIKNKLTITKGEVGGNFGGIRQKRCQGTCIKDPWTKPMGLGSRVEGGEGWGKGGDPVQQCPPKSWKKWGYQCKICLGRKGWLISQRRRAWMSFLLRLLLRTVCAGVHSMHAKHINQCLKAVVIENRYYL